MKVMIAGCGEVGSHIAQSLIEQGATAVMIDSSIDRIEAIEDSIDAMTLKGDATHRSVLTTAGCSGTDLFLAVTGSDSTNLVSAALARDLGARYTIARVDDPGFYMSNSAVDVGTIGINATVCASRLLSVEVFRQILEIDCSRICEFSGYSVFAAFFKVRPEDSLVDKTPGDVKTSAKADLRAVVRNGVLRPLEAIQAIQPDDELLFFGEPEEIGRLISRLKADIKRKAIIIGGGDVGSQIAANLSHYEDKIEIVDSSPERCNELSQLYPDITVLKGDGTDIALLQDLKITPHDYLVSVAHSDEINLMVSLIGRDLGAKYTFTRINRPGYANVYNHLGISGIASSHTVLLNFVDNQLVTECIAKDLKLGLSHDLVEVRIPTVSRGGEVKLGDISLPALSVILGLTRNFKYMDPAKSTVLEKGDSVVVAVPPTAIRELEKAIHKAVK